MLRLALIALLLSVLSAQQGFANLKVPLPPPLVEEPHLSRSDIGNSGGRAGHKGLALQALELGVSGIDMTISEVIASEDGNAINAAGLAHALGLGMPSKPVEAAMLFREAMRRDHLPARLNLAAMYYDGLGVEQDYSEALRLYMDAAKAGSIPAMTIVGDMLRDGLGLTLDHAYSDSIRWFRRAAETDDLVGIHEYANMYFFGYGVGQDFSIARKWFEVGAERGYVLSQFKLGGMYEIGEGVERNFALAAKYYEMAAESGMAEAQDSLGVLYMKGHGVVQDVMAAAHWFELAAEQEYQLSVVSLGDIHFDQMIDTGDPVKGVAYYIRAAELGNVYAMARVGDALRIGRGVPVNTELALAWYARAAEGRDVEASYWLGKLLLEMGGQNTRSAQAIDHLVFAARHGERRAQMKLVDTFLYGQGDLRDIQRAATWVFALLEDTPHDLNALAAMKVIREELSEAELSAIKSRLSASAIIN